MKSGPLGGYLIDTDTFVEHVSSRMVDILSAPVYHLHGINIGPYVWILNKQTEMVRAFFYTRFNKALEQTKVTEPCTTMYIQSPADLTTKLYMLCWILFVQDNFL